MYKPDFLIAYNLCYHAHMCHFVAESVGAEENKVAFADMFQLYFFAVAALLFGGAGQRNIYTLERGAKQAGAVHTYACGTAPSVWYACIRARCFDNGADLCARVARSAGMAGSVFRSGDAAACVSAASALLALGGGNLTS